MNPRLLVLTPRPKRNVAVTGTKHPQLCPYRYKHELFTEYGAFHSVQDKSHPGVPVNIPIQHSDALSVIVPGDLVTSLCIHATLATIMSQMSRNQSA